MPLAFDLSDALAGRPVEQGEAAFTIIVCDQEVRADGLNESPGQETVGRLQGDVFYLEQVLQYPFLLGDAAAEVDVCPRGCLFLVPAAH